jgi:hypothetical protein
LQGKNTHLEKPVKVMLPHILPDISTEEFAFFEVGFAKANHDGVTDASGQRVYEFRRCLGVESSYLCYYAATGDMVKCFIIILNVTRVFA